MAKEQYTCITVAPQTLYITARADAIVRIGCKKPPEIGVYRRDRLPVLSEAAMQLSRYFEGKDRVLTFPIPEDQPPFIRKLYESICAVPYGETRTITEITQALGDPQATESVRMLCRFTPLIVRIPVHRVIDVYTNETDDPFGAALRRLEQRYC